MDTFSINVKRHSPLFHFCLTIHTIHFILLDEFESRIQDVTLTPALSRGEREDYVCVVVRHKVRQDLVMMVTIRRSSGSDVIRGGTRIRTFPIGRMRSP